MNEAGGFSESSNQAAMRGSNALQVMYAGRIEHSESLNVTQFNNCPLLYYM